MGTGRTLVGCPNHLEFGQHVHTAVGTGTDHDIDLQFEVSKSVVLEWTVVIQVTRRTTGDNGTVPHGKRFLCPADLPAAEVFAVEQARESGFDGRSSLLHRYGQEHQGDSGFHDVPRSNGWRTGPRITSSPEPRNPARGAGEPCRHGVERIAELRNRGRPASRHPSACAILLSEPHRPRQNF